MRIIAKSSSHTTISLNEFFSSEPELFENLELAESITRTLKSIMRHPQDVDAFASKIGSKYRLGFWYKHRIYYILFELGDDLILTDLNCIES